MAFPFSSRSLVPHPGPTGRSADYSLDRVLFPLEPGKNFCLSDAYAGVAIFGAIGSGKSSGPGALLARAYLKAGFGGIVFCAKVEERAQWEKWCAATGRSADLVIVNADGPGFNFLDWEASRPGKAGFSVNVVALLDEIASAIDAGGGDSGGGDGSAAFFRAQLGTLLTNLVDLLLQAGLPVSLPLMRLVAGSAPLSMAQLDDPRWKEESACWRILQDADEATRNDPARRADFEEVRAYWTGDYPSFSDRSRSIVQNMFGTLIRPFVTSPLRQLFSEGTQIRPEETFAGRIIIIDLPVHEYRQIGQIAAHVWKWCFQVAVMRRPFSLNNRPVFLFADEFQEFASPNGADALYQSVARSASAATVILTQQREGLRRVLKSDDAVENLLANCSTKIFCQNTGETNEWASDLLGERYTNIRSRSINLGRQHGASLHPMDATGQAGMTRSEHEELRRFIQPAEFTTLKRGGLPDLHVEAVIYCGGKLFGEGTSAEPLPFKLLNFRQGAR
jgi:TraM recognition site of TraD and TraG